MVNRFEGKEYSPDGGMTYICNLNSRQKIIATVKTNDT